MWATAMSILTTQMVETRDNRMAVHNAMLAFEVFPDVGEKTQK